MPQDRAAQRAQTAARRRSQKLWTALDQHLAAHTGRGLLLGVSGGPDSSALMCAVASWGQPGTVEVAVVDHGTRPEASGEAAAVCEAASALGLKAHNLVAHGPDLDEASLRERRFEALSKCACERGLGAIVLAHHQDDVAEAALLRVLGLAPLNAPDPVSSRGPLLVIRPFLALSKADLVATLLGSAFKDETEGARGLIRALAPELDRLAPGWRQAAAEDARRRAEDRQFIDDQSAGLASEIPLPQPSAVLRARLAAFIREQGGRPRARSLRQVLDACRDGRPGSFDLSRSKATVTRTHLLLSGCRGPVGDA